MASGLWLVFVHNNDDSLSQFNLEGFYFKSLLSEQRQHSFKKKKKLQNC